MACLARSERVPGLYRRGGGKCYGFTENRFTSPGRTGEGCRQNGRRAESAIPPPGESATVSRKIDSLPLEGRARDAGRMAVEPRARFLPRGKVLRFHGKSIHFPPKKTDVRLPDQYDREHSFVFRVSCFVFHVAGLELFMKTAGATANRQIYTKHCKSMHHTDRS